LFGREIPVAQPLRHADGFGNVGDRRFFVSLFPKYLQGGVQNFLPAHLRLLGDPHPPHAPFLPTAMQAVGPARSQATSLIYAASRAVSACRELILTAAVLLGRIETFMMARPTGGCQQAPSRKVAPGRKHLETTPRTFSGAG